MEGGPSLLAIMSFTLSYLLLYAALFRALLMHACYPRFEMLFFFNTRPRVVLIFICPQGPLVYHMYSIFCTIAIILKLLDTSKVLTCPPTLSYDKGIGFS